MSSIGFLGPTISSVVVLVIGVLTLTLHVGCCVALGSDSNKLDNEGRGPFFLTVYQWAVAGLLMGVIAVGIYWAIHHSTLSTIRASRSQSPKRDGLLDRLDGQ